PVREVGSAVYINKGQHTPPVAHAPWHFVETPFFRQIRKKILNGFHSRVRRWWSAVAFSEQHRTMRTFTYRVYFTVSPTTYYVVAARNARAAVWRAKRAQRALRLNKRRTAPLQVGRV